MTSIIHDISTLSTINAKHLNKLVDLAEYAINEAVAEDMLAAVDISELDIGIGTLFIKAEGNDLKMKFVPSAKLKEQLIETIKNKHSNLEIKLEDTLASKIEYIYKEIL